jgi:hypothetical protein
VGARALLHPFIGFQLLLPCAADNSKHGGGKMELQYIGQSALPGIPARDLSADDIEKYAKPALKQWEISKSPKAWLISTGLYREPVTDLFVEDLEEES